MARQQKRPGADGEVEQIGPPVPADAEAFSREASNLTNGTAFFGMECAS